MPRAPCSNSSRQAPSFPRRACARGFGNPSPTRARGNRPPSKRRGGRRATRRGSPMLRAILLGPRGALRRAVRRFLRRRAALFGSPLRSASGLRLRPLSGGRARKPRADSAVRRQRAPRGGSLCPRAEPRRRPGAWLAGHARGRRPDPREPEQPVRAPHGDRARRNMILDCGGIMSYETICHGRTGPGHPDQGSILEPVRHRGDGVEKKKRNCQVGKPGGRSVATSRANLRCLVASGNNSLCGNI